MVLKVVFHIGDQSAGGAAIQAALSRTDRPCDGVSLALVSRTGSHGLSGALRRKARANFVQPRFTRLAARIARAGAEGADLAVVSDAGFENVEPEHLVAAIGEFLPQYRDAVQMIAYVRPHADRLWADYAQMVGAGGEIGPELGPDEFVKAAIAAGTHAYAPRFGAWRAAFGDGFVLRAAIRAELTGGDVAGDFLHVLTGVQDPDCPASDAGDGGLTRGDLAMLRAFRLEGRKKSGPAQRQARAAAARYLGGVLENTGAPQLPGGQFSRAVNQRIQAHYNDDARALDQAFFERPLMQTALSDAVRNSPAAPPSSEVSDHFDAQGQRLATLWATLAGDLLAREPGDWPDHFQPRKGDGTKKAGAR